MNYLNSGLLSTYNSLTDKHLAGYFNNTRIRRHLQRVGLITRSGRIVPDKEYRLKLIRRDHQRHVRECLAQAIFHKVLDMERHHQIEIKRKLEDFSRRERVHKIKVERSKRYDEDVIPLLSPKPPSGPRNGHKQPSGPEGEQSESSESPSSLRPNTAPGKMQRPYRLQPINRNSTTASVRQTSPGYRHRDSSDDTEQQFSCTDKDLRPVTMTESSREISPYQLPIINNYITPVPPSTKRTLKGTPNGILRGRRLRPTTAPNVPDIQKDSKFYKSSVHSNVSVTMVYYGKTVHLSHDDIDMRDEVKVFQQHCGGENVCIYKGRLMEGEAFQFVSRRHHGFPFSLTFFLNGLQVDRLSSCCEFKHRKGSRLGGKHGHFGFSSVDGASPCYKCIISIGLDKKPTPPKRTKEEIGKGIFPCNSQEMAEKAKEVEEDIKQDSHSHLEAELRKKQVEDDSMETEAKGIDKGKAKDDYNEDFEADDERADEDMEEAKPLAVDPSSSSDKRDSIINDKEDGEIVNHQMEDEERYSDSEFEEDDKAENKKSPSCSYRSTSSSSREDSDSEAEELKEAVKKEEGRSEDETGQLPEKQLQVLGVETTSAPAAENDQQGLEGQTEESDDCKNETSSPTRPQTTLTKGDTETNKSHRDSTDTADMKLLDMHPQEGKEVGKSGAAVDSGDNAAKPEYSGDTEPERAKSVQEKLVEAIMKEAQCSSEPELSDTSTEEEDLPTENKTMEQRNNDEKKEETDTFPLQKPGIKEEKLEDIENRKEQMDTKIKEDNMKEMKNSESSEAQTQESMGCALVQKVRNAEEDTTKTNTSKAEETVSEVEKMRQTDSSNIPTEAEETVADIKNQEATVDPENEVKEGMEDTEAQAENTVALKESYETQAEVTETQAEETGTQANVTERQAEENETQAKVTEAQEKETEEHTETQEDVTEEQKKEIEVQAETIEAQTEGTESQEKKTEAQEKQAEEPAEDTEAQAEGTEAQEKQAEGTETQAEGTEAQKKQAEEQAEGTEAQEETGAQTEGRTETQEEGTEAQEEETEAQEDGTEPHEKETYVQTELTEAQEEETETQEEGTEAQEKEIEEQEETETQENETEAQEKETEEQTEGTETQAEGTEAQAEGTEAQEKQAGEQAEGTEAQEKQTGEQAEGTKAQEKETEAQAEGTEAQEKQAEAQAEGTEAQEKQAGEQAEGTEAKAEGTEAKENETEAQVEGTEAQEKQAGEQAEGTEAQEKETEEQTEGTEAQEKQAGEQEEGTEAQENETEAQAEGTEAQEKQAGEQAEGTEAKAEGTEAQEKQTGEQAEGTEAQEKQAGEQAEGTEAKAEGTEAKENETEAQVEGTEAQEKQAGEQAEGTEAQEKETEEQTEGTEAQEKQAGEHEEGTEAQENETEAQAEGTEAQEKQAGEQAEGTEAQAEGTEAPEKETEEQTEGTEAQEKQAGEQAEGTEAQEKQAGEQAEGTEAQEKQTEAQAEGTEAQEKQAEGTEAQEKQAEEQAEGTEAQENETEAQAEGTEAKAEDMDAQVNNTADGDESTTKSPDITKDDAERRDKGPDKLETQEEGSEKVEDELTENISETPDKNVDLQKIVTEDTVKTVEDKGATEENGEEAVRGFEDVRSLIEEKGSKSNSPELQIDIKACNGIKTKTVADELGNETRNSVTEEREGKKEDEHEGKEMEPVLPGERKLEEREKQKSEAHEQQLTVKQEESEVSVSVEKVTEMTMEKLEDRIEEVKDDNRENKIFDTKEAGASGMLGLEDTEIQSNLMVKELAWDHKSITSHSDCNTDTDIVHSNIAERKKEESVAEVEHCKDGEENEYSEGLFDGTKERTETCEAAGEKVVNTSADRGDTIVEDVVQEDEVEADEIKKEFKAEEITFGEVAEVSTALKSKELLPAEKVMDLEHMPHMETRMNKEEMNTEDDMVFSPETMVKEDEGDLVTSWVNKHQASRCFQTFIEPLDELKGFSSDEVKESETARTTELSKSECTEKRLHATEKNTEIDTPALVQDAPSKEIVFSYDENTKEKVTSASDTRLEKLEPKSDQKELILEQQNLKECITRSNVSEDEQKQEEHTTNEEMMALECIPKSEDNCRLQIIAIGKNGEDIERPSYDSKENYINSRECGDTEENAQMNEGHDPIIDMTNSTEYKRKGGTEGSIKLTVTRERLSMQLFPTEDPGLSTLTAHTETITSNIE